ncbi:MAG TPA: hypothetical protein VFV65_01380 [Gemmatimonadales bacterium]|nr:hypothetical protein [Gemmatimonadales bacterium]
MNPLRIFTAVMGFMAAVLAIARDDRALVWTAIGLLGSSFAIRIVQRLQGKRDDSDQDPTS